MSPETLESKTEDIIIDGEEGAKPAESPTVESAVQPDGAAKPVAEKLPFHKDPEVQEYLSKMLSRKERDWDEKFKSRDEEYTRRLEQLSRPTSVTSATPEQQQKEEAIRLLAKELLGHPDVRKEYGLDEIKSLRDQFQSSLKESNRKVFDSEMKTVVGKYVEKYGYDKEELEEDFREYISTDPLFEGLTFKEGSLDKIAKLYFSDKEKEMAERETNLKLIKEKKLKSTQGTETSSKGTPSTNVAKEKRLGDFLDRKIREGGGEIVFD